MMSSRCVLRRLRTPSFLSLTLALSCAATAWPQAARLSSEELILVVGASGTEAYGREFEESADRWELSARAGGFSVTRIGPPKDRAGDAPADRELLREAISRAGSEADRSLWIVLLGHGTFDGRVAKFNLRGPDVSASELARWVEPIRRPLAVINCSSSSGPFINKLSGPGRIVLTATKSGFERNYSRFGRYLSEVVAEGRIDLDKDGQTSLLEVFLEASARTAEFYAAESRLKTEEGLLDDNGDGLGTPADWFRGTRAMKRPKNGAATPDGRGATGFVLVRKGEARAYSTTFLERRRVLESRVEELRGQKKELEESDYYGRLELVLTELARLYESEKKAP